MNVTFRKVTLQRPHGGPAKTESYLCLVGMLLFLHFLNRSFFLKYTQWQLILSFDNSTAMCNDLKTLPPGGIRTQDLLFWRWTR
jgi:hypothetical protein